MRFKDWAFILCFLIVGACVLTIIAYVAYKCIEGVAPEEQGVALLATAAIGNFIGIAVVAVAFKLLLSIFYRKEGE